jgi:hypothetical protein
LIGASRGLTGGRLGRQLNLSVMIEKIEQRQSADACACFKEKIPA